MSKTNSLYHIVFCTKQRRLTIPQEHKEDLYRFIWKMITQLKCKLLRIGGVSNHIHILINMHPDVALSQFMQQIKGVSSTWLRRDNRFPEFEGWADGYYAGTIAYGDRDELIEYIKCQELHHSNLSFDDELAVLHTRIGQALHDKDMR